MPVKEPTGVPKIFQPRPGEDPKPTRPVLFAVGTKILVFRGETQTPVKMVTPEEYGGE